MATEGQICTGGNPNIKLELTKTKPANTSRHLDKYILSNIFSRIPADVLSNNFMYQCKQWHGIISDKDFIKSMYHQSKQGIIFMESSFSYRSIMKFMELDESKVIPVRKLHEFKTKLLIESSCNGLLLVRERNMHHVMNPATKKSISLPLEKLGETEWCDLVFLPSVMEYRVVVQVRSAYYHQLFILKLNGCAKPVYESSSSRIDKRSHVFINEVLYWEDSIDYIISFDLCTETFQTLQSPYGSSLSEETSYLSYFINLSGSLSFIDFSVDYSKRSTGLINLWSLRKGEWEKVVAIDRFQVLIAGEEYYPIGFVCAPHDGNLCIFNDYKGILGAYDVKTKQWILLKNINYRETSCNTVHVNSLSGVSPEDHITCAF